MVSIPCGAIPHQSWFILNYFRYTNRKIPYICNSVIILITYEKYFVILQANEVGSSNAMELEGAKRSFNFLKGSGLKMDIFISDRHKGIAKWIRSKQKETKHFNDIWHVNKSINKQLRKVSKEKGCEIINDWLKCA